MDNVKKKLPHNCPACDGSLSIGRLFCKSCGTEISGSFGLPLFLRLTGQEQTFILEFVKSSGSLKDMARDMGISYPTVRNILDDLIDKIKKMEKEENHA